LGDGIEVGLDVVRLSTDEDSIRRTAGQNLGVEEDGVAEISVLAGVAASIMPSIVGSDEGIAHGFDYLMRDDGNSEIGRWCQRAQLTSIVCATQKTVLIVAVRGDGPVLDILFGTVLIVGVVAAKERISTIGTGSIDIDFVTDDDEIHSVVVGRKEVLSKGSLHDRLQVVLHEIGSQGRGRKLDLATESEIFGNESSFIISKCSCIRVPRRIAQVVDEVLESGLKSGEIRICSTIVDKVE